MAARKDNLYVSELHLYRLATHIGLTNERGLVVWNAVVQPVAAHVLFVLANIARFGPKVVAHQRDCFAREGHWLEHIRSFARRQQIF